MECTFCKIIRGELPAAKVYENGSFLIFLDINPANKGHALVIPKRHVETTLELSDGEMGELMALVKRTAAALKKVTRCEGFNIIQNDGKVAGQLVMHAHFHVVPRHHEDGVDFRIKRKKYAEGEIKETAGKLSESFAPP